MKKVFFVLLFFLGKMEEKKQKKTLNTQKARRLSLSRFSLPPCHHHIQCLILAHRITSTHSPSAPATPHAIALFAATRRDITPRIRRALAMESSAPRRVSEACTMVSRWRWRSWRIETPSSCGEREGRGRWKT